VLDDLGLIPALKWYCGRQAQRAGVAIELALDAIDLKSTPQLESACFRIVQESVTNALRHASARHIQVTLHRDEDSLVLEIADDGTGFGPAAARQRGLAGESSGLLGMEERANLLGGRLGIDSAPGAGTRVWVKFSLPEEAHA
jgi:signal transduction histidine kinase